MKYLKAFYAGAMAALGGTSSAYVAGHGSIGLVAALTIAGSVLTSLAVVWGVTNASADSTPTVTE